MSATVTLTGTTVRIEGTGDHDGDRGPWWFELDRDHVTTLWAAITTGAEPGSRLIPVRGETRDRVDVLIQFIHLGIDWNGYGDLFFTTPHRVPNVSANLIAKIPADHVGTLCLALMAHLPTTEDRAAAPTV